MAQLIAIHQTPTDPEHYDRYYFGTHVPIAKKRPGLRKYEVSFGLVSTADGPSGIHLIAILHFDDVASAQSAIESPEGQAAVADMPAFADEGNIEVLLFDTREI